MGLFTNWLESLSYEIKVSPSCLRSISPFSTCSICIEACPEKAITITDGAIAIAEKKCTTCGRCVTICPTQALNGQGPKRLLENGVLLLDGKPLPTKNELLYFYYKGVRSLKIEPALTSNSEIQAVVIETNRLLEIMNVEPFLIQSKIDNTANKSQTYSRRDFFTKISSESKKTVLSTVTPSHWHNNEDCFKLSKLFERWAFYQITLTKDSCNLCQACFRICPSSVFSIENNQLHINEQNCTGCQLCKEICPEKAVVISEQPHHHQASSTEICENTCTTCGTTFYSWSESDHCVVCLAKKEKSLLNFL